MRLFPLASTLLFAASLCVVAAPTASEPAKVQCPKGYVCFTLADAADIDVRLIQLDADLRTAKARNRRWGGVVGCGPVVALAVNDNKVDINGAVACGAFMGLRF